MKPSTNSFSYMTMKEKDFYKIKEYIESHTGIKLPLSKKIMVESRLRKRVRANKFRSFNEYFEAVFSDDGMDGELLQIIDAITTNKTDFFREPDHFTFLSEVIKRERFYSPVKIWSAACSTGEEPYTIAMVLEENRRYIPEGLYSIIASDISQEVLETGRLGRYEEQRIDAVPFSYRNRYFLQSKDRVHRTVRIKPEIRSRVMFLRHNLMAGLMLPVQGFDFIFCRNVLIYFKNEDQKRVLHHLYHHLRPGGYLILGHSETILGQGMKLLPQGPTIYKKPEEKKHE